MTKNVSKIIGSAFIIGLMFFVFNIISLDESVFSVVPTKEEIYNLDEYVLYRERRNKVKMQISYDDLMTNGDEDTREKDWASAIGNYYFAKSIYPDRIEPRRQLCYVLLMECQEDYRACDQAKKEIYYAMKYVHPKDRYNKDYLEKLVEIMDMNRVVEMDEAEAMANIY